MEKISYRRTRDVGAVFSATFAFLKQNFKTFYGSILLFSGPFLFAGSMLTSFVRMPLDGIFSGLPFQVGNFLTVYTSTIMALFLGIVIFMVVLNKNIIVNETLPADQKPTLSIIRYDFFLDFWRMLLNTLLFIAVLLFIGACLYGIFYIFFYLIDKMSYSGGLSSIFAILFSLVFAIVLLPVIGFVPVGAFFICQRDGISIVTALAKVFYYLKGNFWTTWVLSLLAFITYFLMALIVQIPMIVMSLFTTFSRVSIVSFYGDRSILILMVTAISTLLTYLVVALYYLLNIFHFTNLEEKKEGSRLIENIKQIN